MKSKQIRFYWMPLTFERRTEEAVIMYLPSSLNGFEMCCRLAHSAYVTLLPSRVICLLCGKKEDFEYFAPNILPYFVDKGKCGVWHNFWRRVITQCPNNFQVNKEVNLVIFQISSILHQLILKKAIAALMKSILNWIISIEFLISARALFDRALIRYTHTERKYTAEPRGEDVPEIGKWIGRRSGSGRSAQPSSLPSRLLAQAQGQGKPFQIVNGKQVFSFDSCLSAARVFVTTHFWADLTFQNT